MIKFFRKIRKKLLTENKLSRYLLYASGEIILVVIGILFALQFNTWKEESQNKKTEIAYLNGILLNLEEDKNELNRLIKRDSTLFRAYTTILSPFKKPETNLFSPKFIRAIANGYQNHSFKGNSIVFEDLKSSGTLNFIQSDALRFSLLEYYNLCANNKTAQRNNNNQIDILKRETFNEYLDMNSLIEGFIFKDNFNAQIGKLDLSFFNRHNTDPAVKKFANKISVMKALVLDNHADNIFMSERSNRLSVLIKKYLRGESLDITKRIPNEILKAIAADNSSQLEKLLSQKYVQECFVVQKNYPISLLSYSIENNKLACAKVIIDKGADLELACFDKTPLMYTVKYGHLELSKYLVEKGANPNTISNEGYNAMRYAKFYKHPEIEAWLKSISN